MHPAEQVDAFRGRRALVHPDCPTGPALPGRPRQIDQFGEAGIALGDQLDGGFDLVDIEVRHRRQSSVASRNRLPLPT